MRRKALRKTLPAVLSMAVAACGGKPAAPQPPPPARSTVQKPAQKPAQKPHATKASARPAPRGGKPDAAAIARLKSDMVIPVADVGTMELVDTFNDLRGGGKRKHNAIDILSERGTAVVSATGGRVLQLSTSAAGGLMIFATDESEQFLLLYAHLDSYAKGLKPGDPLEPGQVIGRVGTTGNAPKNTPHLHFAIAWSPGSPRWSKGTPIDPRPLLIP